MWLFTYLICLSVHLPTYLLSIHLSIHPSFYPSSVLFLPGTTDELSSLLSLAFSPHSMLALHFSLPLNDGFPAVGSTLHSPLHHQNFPSWINPSTSRHAAVSPVSEWVSEWKSLSRVWLCDSMDNTVHGILQARILEWVAFSFYRGSSQPRNRTGVSCIAGRFFANWPIREVHFSYTNNKLSQPPPIFVLMFYSPSEQNSSKKCLDSQSPLLLYPFFFFFFKPTPVRFFPPAFCLNCNCYSCQIDKFNFYPPLLISRVIIY